MEVDDVHDFASRAAFAIAVTCFAVRTLLAGYTGPPGGDGREFGVVYSEIHSISCAYVKLGKIVIWYEHSGKPEAARPAPGAFLIEDNDATNPVQGVTVLCDGKEVFNKKEIYDRLPLSVVKTIVEAKSATLILQMMVNGEKREELTEADRNNLVKLLNHGHDWKPVVPVYRLNGELTYVLFAGPELKDRWNLVRSELENAIRRRTEDSDRTLLIYVDDDLWFRPRRMHLSSSEAHRNEIVEALERVPTESDLALTPALGKKLADYGNDRNARTFVIFAADPVPREFAEALGRTATQFSIRIDTVWCGDREPDAKTAEALEVITSSTGGTRSRLEAAP